MEESDAKNTNAYIDAFQRRRKTRIVAIAAGALLVLGVAVAVILGADNAAGNANTSSDQSGSVPADAAVSTNNGTIVGGIATYFTHPTLPPDNSTAAMEHGNNPGSVDDSLSNGEQQTDSKSADSSIDASRPPPSTTSLDNPISTTPTPSSAGVKTTPPVSTAVPPTTSPVVTSSPTPAPPSPTAAPTPPPVQPTTPPTPPPTPSTPSPSQPTPPPPPTGNDLKAQIVRQTSIIRAGHGLGPVRWNQDLAVKMQTWADSCPQRFGGGHGGPAGNQNLAGFAECGNNCMHVPGPAQTWWESEEELWDYDTNQSKDGNWVTTGHFQNSLDPGVTEIACGWSTCFNPNVNKQDSLVWCNYLGANNGRIPRPKISKAQIKANLIA
ncbi:hypothetical protein DYB32_003439 [Aphanomyces invadans]|uniref:SCP domain-containing protein n=1 Tax=Aphanomyces invadans TaxID=157072 RepID=A0A3R6YBC3_9STRA|nr:hypothetical protein DYB32_003439 [Aphanomyces invadans]